MPIKAQFFYTNHVNPGGGLFASSTSSVLAELLYGSMDVAIANGSETQIGGSLTGTPVHPGSLLVTYLVDNIIKTITDDGAGNLIGDLDPIGANSITYSTGVFNAVVETAPDEDSVIQATWEYGEDLPSITTPFVRELRATYNDNAISVFVSGNLRNADFSGDDLENFEDSWKKPQAVGIPSGSPPPYNEDAVSYFDDDPFAGANPTATKAIASFDSGTPENVEDFEEQWKSNEIWQSLPTTSQLSSGSPIFGSGVDDFESSWTLTLQGI